MMPALSSIVEFIVALVSLSLICGTIGTNRGVEGFENASQNEGNSVRCAQLLHIPPTSPVMLFLVEVCRAVAQVSAEIAKANESVILFAVEKQIRILSLQNSEVSNSTYSPIENLANPIAVDYDPVDKLVYWTDNQEHAIFRTGLDGKNVERILQDDIRTADGLAIDVIARNLYWADSSFSYIGVASLDGRFSKRLIEDGVDRPRAIALDPAKGLMYWSDWGAHTKIERMSLDGTDREIIVSSTIRWPNGIALNEDGNLLYWADGNYDKIEVVDLGSLERKLLSVNNIPHIYGLSYLDNYLYWTDWRTSNTERMSVTEPSDREVLLTGARGMGIKAARVSPHRVQTNPCADNNGGCPELCLYTPEGPRCH